MKTRALGRKWTFALAAGLLCMSAAARASDLSVSWTQPADDVTLSVSDANASVFTAHVSGADTEDYSYEVEYYISSAEGDTHVWDARIPGGRRL